MSNDPATTGDNTPKEDKAAEKEAKEAVKEAAKEQKEYPVNPRFPGEGNPDFKG